MKETHCPICPRHCDLSQPHCQRGEMYAKIGETPKRHQHQHTRLIFEEREQQLIMKYLHHAVGVVDRGGFTQDMTEHMFDVLTKEEIIQLEELLEKLSDHWIEMSKNK